MRVATEWGVELWGGPADGRVIYYRPDLVPTRIDVLTERPRLIHTYRVERRTAHVFVGVYVGCRNGQAA